MTPTPADWSSNPALARNRRHFLARSGLGLGTAALASLLGEPAAAEPRPSIPGPKGVMPAYHVAPRARRVISLFMSGGPSQLDLFDYKPLLNQYNGQDLPDSVRMGQRLTGMSANQAALPMAGSLFKFARHGLERAGYLGRLLDEVVGRARVGRCDELEVVNDDEFEVLL